MPADLRLPPSTPQPCSAPRPSARVMRYERFLDYDWLLGTIASSGRAGGDGAARPTARPLARARPGERRDRSPASSSRRSLWAVSLPFGIAAAGGSAGTASRQRAGARSSSRRGEGSSATTFGTAIVLAILLLSRSDMPGTGGSARRLVLLALGFRACSSSLPYAEPPRDAPDRVTEAGSGGQAARGREGRRAPGGADRAGERPDDCGECVRDRARPEQAASSSGTRCWTAASRARGALRRRPRARASRAPAPLEGNRPGEPDRHPAACGGRLRHRTARRPARTRGTCRSRS